jgi:hypothetical protein
MIVSRHRFQIGDIVQPMGRDHRFKVIAASRSWVWVDGEVEMDETYDRGRDGPIAFQARDVELVEPATPA